MRLKILTLGAALTLTTSAAAIAWTALPAAAEQVVSVPAIDKTEFRWLCAEANGEYFETATFYYCDLPNGTQYRCQIGGLCRIYFVEAAPTTPPPVVPRPTVSAPGEAGR